MAGELWTGIKCVVIGGTLLAASVNFADAKGPDPALTIARADHMIEQIKSRSTYFKRTGRLAPHDWGLSVPIWRPATDLRSHPPPPVIRQLIANAICRQHSGSLKAAHRLDGVLMDRVFGYEEALIANEFARRQGLAISFRMISPARQDQSLKEVNRRRRFKRVLGKQGPEEAMKLFWSFRLLCGLARMRARRF